MEVHLDILFAQIINFLIVFFVFKYFLGDKITKQIEDRRELIRKLKNAENEYKAIIVNANIESTSIINKALDHKKLILDESKKLSEQNRQEILQNANQKSQEILQQAQVSGEKIKKELADNWEDGVKQTAKLLVKKMFEKDILLQDEYVAKILKEMK